MLAPLIAGAESFWWNVAEQNHVILEQLLLRRWQLLQWRQFIAVLLGKLRARIEQHGLHLDARVHAAQAVFDVAVFPTRLVFDVEHANALIVDAQKARIRIVVLLTFFRQALELKAQRPVASFGKREVETHLCRFAVGGQRGGYCGEHAKLAAVARAE